MRGNQVTQPIILTTRVTNFERKVSATEGEKSRGEEEQIFYYHSARVVTAASDLRRGACREEELLRGIF